MREETETNRATRESSSTSSVHECSQHPSDSEPEMRPHTPGAILSQKEAPEHHTVDRHGALSAPYLAPECRSGQHPTECSDLWGLGCLSYHLYCGTQSVYKTMIEGHSGLTDGDVQYVVIAISYGASFSSIAPLCAGDGYTYCSFSL